MTTLTSAGPRIIRTFQGNSYRTRAWSCDVRVVVEDRSALHRVAADVDALVNRVDLAASRFRRDSALSAANAQAGRPTFIPWLLTDLIGIALHAALTSDGAVDPTVHAGLLNIGYDRDISELPTARDALSGLIEQVATPRAPVAQLPARGRTRDWRDVSLNRELGLLRMPADVALDLGATAKARTADLAAHDASVRYQTGVLVEIGGDIAVAGERDGGWVVEVSETGPDDDLYDPADAQAIALHRGGVATSTTMRRRWLHDGVPVHHIIDPATGAPADGPWRTATVVADSALEANTASTAAIVKGTDALSWLTAHGYAARLVDRIGGVQTTPGWPLASSGAARRIDR
ncbi:thiamine biosynthesis lipoprotein [Frankineae bacterium MT45]|nr:thiamine biosynthesis lipoprotein [Frankineae bacterium MT45]